MKHISLLLLCFVSIAQNKAQTVYKDDLKQLSKNFQRVFRENGWIMNAPMSSGGLEFTHGLTFFRVKDSVQWVTTDNEKYHSLNPLIMSNNDIQDSIVYMVWGVHDSTTKSQIVDIYWYGHITDLSQSRFPNSGVSCNFAQGMAMFMTSLSEYFDSTSHNLVEDTCRIKVYFSGIKPYSLMAVSANDKVLKETVSRFFSEKNIKYQPPIRFGRPMYSHHIFQLKKENSHFVVEHADYGESLFCYDDPYMLWFIGPIHEDYRPKDEWSFLYDEKWTEEEFLSSVDIVRIKRKIDIPTLSKILIEFQSGGMVKPFSAIYKISILEK